MRHESRYLFITVAVLLVASFALGQGTTGSLNGSVSHEGGPLPGVTITITSPGLQGSRVAVSNVNGDYNFPALPPGDYLVTFEMDGMGTVTKSTRVGLGKTERVNGDMQLSAVAEAITVTAAAPAVLETTEVQSNYGSELVEDLPIVRTIQGTVLLAPGVTSNGPGSTTANPVLVIGGGYAYDSLFLVNGAVTNENLRGQTDNLFIEDAIQETTVTVGSVSAEYGRFTGGVVSAITKSGGNEFSGSFRDSFTNPSWDKTSDYGEAQQASTLDETYEATLGGRIVRDRLWFFGAGRYVEQTFPAFFFDGGALDTPVERPATVQTDERYEVKLTGQITPKHSLVGSYLSYEVDQTPHCAFGCWELSTMDLDGRQLPREMITAQYNGILSSNLLVEAGYSTRDLQFVGSGGDHLTSDFTDPRDIALGTWAYDYTVVGGAWGAPIFCGICDPEVRENEYYVLKSTYYMATAGAGTHNIVGGYENFTESRVANNYQSGSNFGVYVFGMSPEYDADGSFRPIISSGDLLRYSPIAVLSKGSDFVTDSFFVNDKWDLNSKWSFNLGVRYDINDGQDSAGNQISDDSAFSPRIGAIYDIKGDGRMRVNASYSKYVSRIQETIGGAGGGGTPSAIYYQYDGPQIGGAGTGLGSFDVLEQFFVWFLGIGGTGNTSHLVGATIPGVNTRFNGSLKSPNTEELTIGFGSQIGTRGFFRVDVIDREWGDFYTTTTAPGDQIVVLGNPLDVLTYTNTDELERTYQAVQLQASYRVSDRLNIGGNYTWSEAKGNDVGETAGGGPATSLAQTYPEYRAFAQNNPSGFLPTDQTHKARLWVTYDQPLGAFGNLNLSLLERYDTGLPYSATANVDVASYTDNPGYATPPAAVLYYFSDRGEYRFEDSTATDLAVNWELPIRSVNLFVQGEILNVFNEQAQVGGGAAVAVTKPFDPFNETPNECPAGTATDVCIANNQHFRKSTAFGAPTGAASFQLPLTYRVSAGIRF